MTAGAPRIAAYGYFGMGNIGNEGSLAAMLEYLRKTYPEAALSCFAAGAVTVRRDHGIPATQLMTFRADRAPGGPLTKVAKAASRIWDIPRTFSKMGDVDVLVVPGTGVLETALVATPWGLPYWLFLATASCRLRRRKVALVSVGAEHAKNPVTRWLFRWTVRLSHYCSYRDEESRNAARSMGVRGRLGEAFPDLAFSLPTPEGQPERPGHVVIGVMAYNGSPDDPHRGPHVQRTYVEHMAQLITRLVDHGRSVTLVVGDVADHGLAVEIEERVRSARPEVAPGRMSVSGADTMTGIMTEMAGAEVVVASRFHNLICALMMSRPTVSLGYAGKNVRLMTEFGLDGFSQAVDSFDVDRLAGQIADVQRVQPSVEALMKDTLHRFEDELDDQFRRLFTELLDSDHRRGRHD